MICKANCEASCDQKIQQKTVSLATCKTNQIQLLAQKTHVSTTKTNLYSAGNNNSMFGSCQHKEMTMTL